MGVVNDGCRPWLEVIWQGFATLVLATVLGLGVNHLRPGKLPLVSDWSPQAQLTSPSGDSLEISLDKAAELFFSQGAVFVDARSPDVYAGGHIQGARNLPWDEFDSGIAGFTEHVARESVIITYCDGDACSLSKELAMALLGKGYDHVRVLVNGWTLWQGRGLPVEGGADPASVEAGAG